MKNYKSLLESLKITDAPVRRYSLSEMISESYKVVFQCEKGTNLYKIAEAHLQDVRDNPTKIDHLSTQLGAIKSLLSLKESGELKDEELIPEKSHDTVEPKEERALDLKESKDDEDVEEKDDENLLDESSIIYRWGDWQSERGSACRVRFYSPSMDLTDQTIGVVYEKCKDHPYYGAEIYDNSTASVIEERADDSYHFDTEEEAMEWVEEWFSKDMRECDDPKKTNLEESDEPELTDEELEELTKHLETIRKERKEAASKSASAPVEESSEPSKGIKVHCAKMKESSKDWSDVKESLSNFSSSSSSKAFYKTFKKMQEKLKEGKALTRQESITLYKAANSAMTQLSVELEHNPEFLATFKECTSLLSKDVNSVLSSLKEGKAPSKKTMKSLAKFSEALLLEDEEEDEELPPIEDEEFISDEEGDIVSEEEEEFDQEYADARVELHKELADEHADTEDPGVQEKLAQDVEEISELPGVTEEQLAELTGEEVPAEETPTEEEPAPEETTEEEPAEDDDITDDELAELKRHLQEMRKAKRAKSE